MSLVGVVTLVTSAITGAVVSVVVVLSLVVDASSSLLLLQEMKMELKRNREKMMSICLTWFPSWWIRKTQVIPELGLFYNEVGILLGGCSGRESILP